ncbi:MAG: amidohydrolase [Treponema sp.]|jgi:predicted TIM-barrel fold metal-dependent hydrolase|nr:amidohydrolase [Treponema sp.]
MKPKIYDMHIHLWSGGNPDSLIDRFDKAGIHGGAVFSEAPEELNMGGSGDGKERLARVLSFTAKHPERLFPVLWIHPDEKDALSLVKTAAERGIKGFKIICNNYYVYENKSMDLLSRIAETGLPICFHSGILWDPGVSGKYNRPLNWEKLIEIPNIRFSMAHCSWPWYDECIALYGKLLFLSNQEDFSCEMYLDLTPGTPQSYRRDLLTKLLTSDLDVEHHMMFGSDCDAGDYRIEWAEKWIGMDNAIYDDLDLDAESREKIFGVNMLRFFGISGEKYRYRPANMDGS